tara:strand:+ start:143444 stop:143563 length:120 start_codon:yes stop_codon:yes gene_type:complete
MARSVSGLISDASPSVEVSGAFSGFKSHVAQVLDQLLET